jgi:hypothetical protein
MNDRSTRKVLNHALIFLKLGYKKPLPFATMKKKEDYVQLLSQAFAFHMQTLNYSDHAIHEATGQKTSDDVNKFDLPDFKEDNHDEPSSSEPQPRTDISYPKFEIITTQLNIELIDNFIYTNLSKLIPESKAKFVHHPADINDNIIPQINDTIRLISSYWSLLLCLFVHIRNAQYITGFDFATDPAKIASHYAIPLPHLESACNVTYNWPYFMQVLSIMLGPTEIFCPDQKHLDVLNITAHATATFEKRYIFPKNQNPSKVPLVLFVIPPRRIIYYLDKIREIKPKLNQLSVSPLPRTVDLTKVASAFRSKEKSTGETSLLLAFARKQLFHNQLLTHKIIHDGITSLAPKACLLTVPRPAKSCLAGYQPMPPKIFNRFHKKYGFAFPSWISQSNFSANDPETLNEFLFNNFSVCSSKLSQPSVHFPILLLTDEPLLQVADRQIAAYSNCLPFPPSMTYVHLSYNAFKTRKNCVTHLTITSPKLSFENMSKVLHFMQRPETLEIMYT